MTSLKLELPYPPTINSYYQYLGHRRFVGSIGKVYKAKVADIVRQTNAYMGSGRIEMTIILCPPDKRVRDIDNPVKPLLDALVQAKCFEDDSLIDSLLILRGNIVKSGKALVTIECLQK